MDTLAEQADSLFSALKASGIPVIRGFVSDESGAPRVNLDAEGGTDPLKLFAETAVLLGARFVVAHVSKLQQEELDEAIEYANESADGDAAIKAKVLAELDTCRHRIGHVGGLTVCFFTPAPVLEFVIDAYAPWNTCVYGTAEALRGDKADDYVKGLTSAQASNYAKRLAADPRFLKAENADARMYVAKVVFGEEVDSIGFHLAGIVKEAKCIVDIDVKPKKDAESKEKAQWLMTLGRSRPEAALEMGITKERLAKLLG